MCHGTVSDIKLRSSYEYGSLLDQWGLEGPWPPGKHDAAGFYSEKISVCRGLTMYWTLSQGVLQTLCLFTSQKPSDDTE